MKKSFRLYDAGLEEYPMVTVVLGNVVFASIIAAGTIACWRVAPAFGLAYLVVSVALVYGLLRRIVCTRCYYYGKRCGAGWGLLAAVLFSRGPLEEFNESAGAKLAPLVYGLIVLVPLVALGVLLVQGATTALLVLLGFLLGMAFYSSGPGRRRSCCVCKMRLFCRGSAAK